jgi:hypothetical protein
MSTILTLTNASEFAAREERAHRMRLYAASAAAVLLIIMVAVYGADYYWLGAVDRPFSPKHALLKPSGQIGINLGILGFALFLIIFLYPLRKKIPWFAKVGKTRHWLDFHVVAGLTAPVLIAFHCSFKFHGLAGMAFWIMSAVALSGVVGRYMYAQIPRSLSSAELSLKELHSMEAALTRELSSQTRFTAEDFAPILQMPGPEEVRQMPVVRALLLMFGLDVARPFRIARLRARALSRGTAEKRGVAVELLVSLGGFRHGHDFELEQILATAQRKSALSKRIVFLARTQQVFHLWHVVHRPFSYSFAVLALMHIVVVVMLGFV